MGFEAFLMHVLRGWGWGEGRKAGCLTEVEQGRGQIPRESESREAASQRWGTESEGAGITDRKVEDR